MAEKDKKALREERERRRPSRVLMYFYLFFLVVSIIVIGRIGYIQFIWKPDPKFIKHFQPSYQITRIEPERGSIIDHNGRLLAISTRSEERRVGK